MEVSKQTVGRHSKISQTDVELEYVDDSEDTELVGFPKHFKGGGSSNLL